MYHTFSLGHCFAVCIMCLSVYLNGVIFLEHVINFTTESTGIFVLHSFSLLRYTSTVEITFYCFCCFVVI